MKPVQMRCLFIGGPGRSGTSHVASRLGTHPQIASFPDIELKLFTEKGGLLDLYHSLVQTYSPNRATVASQQFVRMTQAIINGQYGQPALSTLIDQGAWEGVIDQFMSGLLLNRHPTRITHGYFCKRAHGLIQNIGILAAQRSDPCTASTVFLEKTPHALLGASFLEAVAPGSAFLHVMRDPRSVAFSLRAMRWGPETLDTCCEWVRSYCDTYAVARQKAFDTRLDLNEVFIEELAASPQRWSEALTGWLGLPADHTLLIKSSTTVLNTWKNRATQQDLDLLQRELSAVAIQIGYDPDAIGTFARGGSTAVKDLEVEPLSGQ